MYKDAEELAINMKLNNKAKGYKYITLDSKIIILTEINKI